MDQTLIIGAAAAALWVTDRMGWLPSKKSPSDAAAELQLAEHTISRVEAERDAARAERDMLEQTRSLEPILEMVSRVFETQERTLEKLAHFNGALKRNEEGLREATEALRMVAGLVVGAADIRPSRRKPPAK